MSKLQRRKALAPVDHSPRMTWCNLETEIVNYFRSHGCEVLQNSGDFYLVLNSEDDEELNEISLSDLAHDLAGVRG